jgi:hypothetical protein
VSLVREYHTELVERFLDEKPDYTQADDGELIGDTVSSNLTASAGTDTTPGEANPTNKGRNPEQNQNDPERATGRRRPVECCGRQLELSKATDGGTAPNSLFIDLSKNTTGGEP